MHVVEKKKAEPVGMDNEKKREKNQRVVTRLEKELQDATKKIQALTVPSKIVTALLAMAIMFGVNKRCPRKSIRSVDRSRPRNGCTGFLKPGVSTPLIPSYKRHHSARD